MARTVPSRHAGSFLRSSLLAGLVLGGAAGPAFAQTVPTLPPAGPASPAHHAGKPVFFQLVTPSLAAAKTFYGALFGWQFQDTTTGTSPMAIASIDDQPVAALIERPLPAGAMRQPAWLTFFSVADVDASNALAVKQGARPLVGPHSVAGIGREAIYTDPQGAVFATLTAVAGDPPDALANPGEWIWSALLTTNPDTDAAFYQSVFNYDVFTLPRDATGPHFLLASDDFARATANPLPPGASAHPHWLNFIRVADAGASAAEVTRLGGHVLVTPHMDRHGGRIAVATDPSGARFGLMEWTQTDNTEHVK